MKATAGSSTRFVAPLQASRRKKLGLTLPPNPCPGAQLSRQANAAEADLARVGPAAQSPWPAWNLSATSAICRHFIEPRSGLATDLGECERSPRRDKPGILVSALGSDKELVFCFYLFCHFFPHPRESCWVLLCGM